MAWFKKQPSYDYNSCEKACADEPSMGVRSFVEAVRQIVDAPRPESVPWMILLAECGSIVNEQDIPPNVRVIYYVSGTKEPTLLSAGY